MKMILRIAANYSAMSLLGCQSTVDALITTYFQSKAEVDSQQMNLVAKCDETFSLTLERFRQLLAQNKSPENIIWIMPEDVLLTGKPFIYIRVPVPTTNGMQARRTFDEGLAHRRGLLISTIFETNSSSFCYVWYPGVSEEMPRGAWPQDGSVKLSAASDESKVTGREVKNRPLWAILKLRYRSKQHLKAHWLSGGGLSILVSRNSRSRA
jgi:hypothetical protein